MKKIISLFLSIVMIFTLVVSITGCSNNKGIKEAETRKVIDMSGTEVEVPAVVDSYCVLYASAINVCAMLDEGCAHMDGMVKGWMDWTYRLFPNLKEKTKIFDKNSVTAEEIIQTGTQVVFWSNSTHEGLIEPLTQAGIACVYVPIKDVDSLKKVVSIVADVLNTEYARKTAEKYNEECDKMIAEVDALTKGIGDNGETILCLRDSSSLTVQGKNSFEGFWTNEAHMKYVEASSDSNTKVNVTIEQILEWDPDNILFEIPADLDALKNDPTWSNLSAFKNGKVYNNPSCLNSWSAAGVEYLLQYEWAISTFYPELAASIDMKADLIKFYKDFFDYEMTEQEAGWILAGQMPQ